MPLERKMREIKYSESIAISGGRSPEVTIDPVTGKVTIRTCTEVR